MKAIKTFNKGLTTIKVYYFNLRPFRSIRWAIDNDLKAKMDYYFNHLNR